MVHYYVYLNYQKCPFRNLIVSDLFLQVEKAKGDALNQIQKSFQKSSQESNVKRLEVEITSFQEENTRLRNDKRSLTAQLEALEIRNKHLALSVNRKVSEFNSMMFFCSGHDLNCKMNSCFIEC